MIVIVGSQQYGRNRNDRINKLTISLSYYLLTRKGVVKMKYISWAKVNKLLWNVDEYRESMEKIKTYKIDFPIWRKRSKTEVVELESYDDIVKEYATSSNRKNATNLIFK